MSLMYDGSILKLMDFFPADCTRQQFNLTIAYFRKCLTKNISPYAEAGDN
jgi:hypothetical protein